MAIIEALCVSEKKGLRKHPIDKTVFVAGHGIEGDAHAGKWHRQVSLLSMEDIESVKNDGLPDIASGDFAENIILSGLDLSSLGLGSVLRLGDDVEISITQKGKVCHSHCSIYKLVGDCIMHRLGIFARVESGGSVKVGDTAKVVKIVSPEKFQAVVLTISDSCSRGKSEDTAGPAVCLKLKESLNAHIYCNEIIPDEQKDIEQRLRHYCGGHSIDLILTVGGTGFSPRDVTPEAAKAVIERLTPGLDEAMRASSMLKTPRAMLSRGVSGISGTTLIINLPGSERAAIENLDAVLGGLEHGILKLRGDTSECGN
ncbi:molybdenum cofactor synthesis domain-containing protein [Candidatus Latescibacterota bacterium]